jgi:hypothetical protein
LVFGFLQGLTVKPESGWKLYSCDWCSPAHLEHALETALHLLRHVCATQKQLTPVLVAITQNLAPIYPTGAISRWIFAWISVKSEQWNTIPRNQWGLVQIHAPGALIPTPQNRVIPHKNGT